MHCQGTEVPGEYPGKPIRIHKISTNFLLLSAKSWIQILYLFLSLTFFSAYRDLVLSTPSSISLSILLFKCCSEPLVIILWSSWASPALVSETHIIMALFCVHWICLMFYCWFLCQGRVEHSSMVCWEHTALCFVVFLIFFSPIWDSFYSKTSLFLDFLVIFAFYFK